MTVYLLVVNPYKTILSRLLSTFNEFMLILMWLTCIRFHNPVMSPTENKVYGNILVAIVLFTIMFNWIAIIISGVISFLIKRKKKVLYKEHTATLSGQTSTLLRPRKDTIDSSTNIILKDIKILRKSTKSSTETDSPKANRRKKLSTNSLTIPADNKGISQKLLLPKSTFAPKQKGIRNKSKSSTTIHKRVVKNNHSINSAGTFQINLSDKV